MVTSQKLAFMDCWNSATDWRESGKNLKSLWIGITCSSPAWFSQYAWEAWSYLTTSVSGKFKFIDAWLSIKLHKIWLIKVTTNNT